MFNFQNFLLENNTQLKLYHGSPYIFREFKNKVTFFSETINFADEYAEDKSFDQGLDSETNIYTVTLNCNIFDINNNKDFNKLKNILPDVINYSYNNFGFDAELPKDEFLENMKGNSIIKPFIPENGNINSIKIGDKIPDSKYKYDNYIVYKIDNDNIYVYFEKLFNKYFEKLFKYKNKNNDSEFGQLLIKLYKEYSGEKSTYFDNHDLQIFINYVSNECNQKYNHQQYTSGKFKILPKEKIENFNQKLKNEIKLINKKVLEKIVNEKLVKTFNLKPITIKLKDTWRFFENETIYNAITKLGYEGYIAKENNINTYAIFNPQKNTTIIDYEIPIGEHYNNYDEYKS
jgi:hypothetical protein